MKQEQKLFRKNVKNIFLKDVLFICCSFAKLLRNFFLLFTCVFKRHKKRIRKVLCNYSFLLFRFYYITYLFIYFSREFFMSRSWPLFILVVNKINQYMLKCVREIMLQRKSSFGLLCECVFVWCLKLCTSLSKYKFMFIVA